MNKGCQECEKNKFVLPYEYLANPLMVAEYGGNLYEAQMGGDQQSQIMEIIKMYAQLHNTEPQVIIQKLQELDENGQQQALQTMVSEIQQGSAQQPQQEYTPTSYADNTEFPEMQSGGAYNYQQTGGRGYRGYAGGFGNSGPDYIAPAINSAIGDSKLFSPIKALTGYMGLGAGLAASGLGFGKSAQLLGDKILPDGAVQNGFDGIMNTGNKFLQGVVDFGVSGTLPENYMRNNMTDKKNTNVSPIDKNRIQKTDFTQMPVFYENPKYKNTMVSEYGGTLPKAQMGIPEGFDFSDPYGLNKERFGQTANYADTLNYDASNDNTDYNSQYMNMSTADEQLQQPIDYNKQYMGMSLEDEQLKKEKQEKEKQVSSFNGMEYAQKGMLGLGTFSNYLQSKNNQNRKAEYEDMLKRVGNTDFRLASNGPNPYGDYTLNVGPSNNFQLGMTTPMQDFGTKGNARYGGSMNRSYKQGGEYQVSEEELLQLMQNGAEIEFMN